MILYRNREWLYEKYWIECLNLAQIAREAGVNATTIFYWMETNDIKRRGPSGKVRKKYWQNEEWLYQKYVIERLSTVKIANMCKTWPYQIRYWMVKFNIKRRTIGEAQIGNKRNFGKPHSQKARKQLSENLKKAWKNPRFVKNFLRTREIRPNKLEKFFDFITPDNVRYVGNYKWWRKLPNGKYKNPDFKITGQNKVIELFGGKNFYHTEEEGVELIKLYSTIGIKCLIFWEKEVYENSQRVLNKVGDFINGTLAE